jgi:hypothetical protein
VEDASSHSARSLGSRDCRVQTDMVTRLSQDERRAVAQRIFAALCAHYPKHYIAMIDSKAVARTSEQVLTAGMPAVERSDASVGGGDVCVSRGAWGGTHEE